MSWIRDTKDKRTWLQKMCAKVLKNGPVPKHVAFIMDGNRRFAKKNSIDREHGHLMGFDKLAEYVSNIKLICKTGLVIDNFNVFLKSVIEVCMFNIEDMVYK